MLIHIWLWSTFLTICELWKRRLFLGFDPILQYWYHSKFKIPRCSEPKGAFWDPSRAIPAFLHRLCLVPLADLWHLSPDAKGLCALLLYSKLKEAGRLWGWQKVNSWDGSGTTVVSWTNCKSLKWPESLSKKGADWLVLADKMKQAKGHVVLAHVVSILFGKCYFLLSSRWNLW